MIDGKVIIYLALSYIVGSIPFGYIFCKVSTSKDVREIGSGSTGATNVTRLCGKIIGILVLICDWLKGFIWIKYCNQALESLTLIYLCSIVCMLGHIYPVWLKFRGGKGVAVFAGISSVISLSCSMLSALLWAVTLILTQTSFVASFVLCFSFVLLDGIKGDFSREKILFYLLIVTVILLSHRKNIKYFLK